MKREFKVSATSIDSCQPTQTNIGRNFLRLNFVIVTARQRIILTVAVAFWLERPRCEREVVGSIPGRDRLKSKVVASPPPPFGAQDYGNYTTTGPPVS